MTAGPASSLPVFHGKLVPARIGPEPLIRERLLGELDRLSPAGLTLVDAPIGFGKTVLVQTWIARTEAAVAWLSLDDADNDSSRLWTYLATSIDRVRSGLGRPAITRLQAPGASPDTVVDDFLDAVTSYGAPIVFVLDDLHVVTDETCLRSLERAVVNLPPHARAVATTRSDPRLPLGRLRARGALGEIRARELAFTFEEARELIVGREGIALDDEHVALLVERTEGWPAGLYLAALWLRELDNPAAGVESFHGDHRHVADYLTSEVLDTLDEETRRFLLESSTFGRFSGGMCDALLDRKDSARRLRELETSNGFLVGLDTHGEWFRYHHLFQELLQLELSTVEPDAPQRLHRAAGAWCLEQGLLEDALEHAGAAGDLPLVAAILSAEHRTLLRSGRLVTVLRWCDTLPDGLLLESPEIPLAGALAAGLLGRSASDRHRLTAVAERARDERPQSWTPYHEAGLGIAAGAWAERDLSDVIELARRTVEIARQVPELTVPALANLSFVLYLAGEEREAGELAREAIERPEVKARPHSRVLALATLALLDLEAGSPDGAEGHAREAIAVALAAGVDESASGGAARVALGAALAARGKLREAEREAARGEKLRRQDRPELAHLHALLVLAGIRIRRGRLEAAARDLERVRAGVGSFSDAGRLPEALAALELDLEDAAAGASASFQRPSAAEVSVLELLATDLSQREIGARLFLSLNTVKTHSRAIYRKLGVGSRDAAVERARTLGLLDAHAEDSPG